MSIKKTRSAPSKKKVIMSMKEVLESGETDLDVRLALAWGEFRQELNKRLNNVKNVIVDLGFESTIDGVKHHNFSSEEVIWLEDVTITNDNSVAYVVPFTKGNKKMFLHREAELVNVVDEEEKMVRFDHFVDAIFTETFAKVPEVSSIEELQKNVLRKDKNMATVLRESDEFLKQYTLKNERKIIYAKMKNYGIF